MLDQNTDRMWYVIGAIVIGGLILTSSIILFTDVAFASVQDALSMFSNEAGVNEIPDYYVLATDEGFKDVDGLWRYVGDDDYVIIPDKIGGERVDTYRQMFEGVDVKGVASTNPNIKDMSYMFTRFYNDTLEIDFLDTSGVEDMRAMFYGSELIELKFPRLNLESLVTTQNMFSRSKFERLDLTGMDTSNVSDMEFLFHHAEIEELNVEGMDITNLTRAYKMFSYLRTDELDISSLDFNDRGDNISIRNILYDAYIKKVYVRDVDNLDLLSNSSESLSKIQFIVK